MWRLMQILYIGLFPLNVLAFGKAWDYTILSTSGNSSNENLLRWTTDFTRIELSNYSFSGKLRVNVDMDDRFQIECRTYFSSSGKNKFKLLPIFGVPKQPVPVFMATFYRINIMSSLYDCSNAPQSIHLKPPVLKNGTYTFNKCPVSIDTMPSHVESGFYKIILIGTSRKLRYYFEVLAKVEPKDDRSSEEER